MALISIDMDETTTARVEAAFAAAYPQHVAEDEDEVSAADWVVFQVQRYVTEVTVAMESQAAAEAARAAIVADPLVLG